MAATIEVQGPDAARPREFRNLIETSAHVRKNPETKIGSISTRHVPVHEQFDLWRSVAAAPFGTVSRDDPYDEPFHATAETYITSQFGYARHGIVHAASVERDKRAIALGDFDGIGIQLRLKGHELANDYRSGELFAPGKIRLHDLKRPFFSSNDGYENLAIVAPTMLLAERVPGIEQLNGYMLPDGAMTLLLQDHMKTALRVLEQATRDEAEQMGKVTLEVLTAAYLASHYTGILGSSAVPHALRQAIRLCIDRNLHRSALDPAFIARAVGVSRSKLYEACQPYDTPMEMVRARRLDRAADILRAQPHLRITEVAAMVGYENLETFSRQFRREFGCSARDYRQQG